MDREADLVAADAVRAELWRVVASPDFGASERNCKFLSHVVEETLARRADRIKAYAIATTVFGRDERFDPQLDSIVRIEAGRLRRSLERYYLTAGRDDPVRIEIPRGSYVPVFTSPPPPTPPPPSGGRAPTILVTAFDEEGDQSAFPHFTTGFTRALIIALTRFTGLRVYGAETALRHPADRDLRGSQPGLEVDYLLTGGTSLESGRLEVDVVLVEDRTGRAVWADSFERPLAPAEISQLRNEVANRVARTLAQPYGVIQTDRARDSEGAAPEHLGSYNAVLGFYRYWRSFDPAGIEAVRLNLERTIAAEPDYAEAFACLSLVYSNASRFRHPTGAPELDLSGRARSLARRAVVLAPNSCWAHCALGLATWFAGDVEDAIALLETGRALNPNDTTLLAELGLRYAILADWERAVPLLEDSYARNPAQPSTYRMGLALDHYAHGRDAEALAEARRIDAPDVIYIPVMIAAAAARLDRAEEAAQAVAAIRAIDPAYGSRVRADLESRHVAAPLVRALVEGLARAGLDVRPPAGALERRAAP